MDGISLRDVNSWWRLRSAMVEEVGGPREPSLGGEVQEAMAVGIAATFREDAIALNVPRHTTVYVGRIPKTYDEERVDRLLGACGRVRSFLRAIHPETNAAKHYGFCEYRDGLSCMRAIEVLDGLQGKSPGSRPTRPSSPPAGTAALGSLPPRRTPAPETEAPWPRGLASRSRTSSSCSSIPRMSLSLSLLAHHPLQQLVGLLLAQALAGADGRLGRWALPVTIE